MDKLIKKYSEPINPSVLINKGLYKNNSYNDKYYRLYRNYRMLLDKYLVNKLSLDTYDNRIASSNLKFIPVKEEDMDFYEYISSMNLKYIYLRNKIYVEKLSPKDIDALLNISFKTLNNPTKEIFDIIENTYISVIDGNSEEDITALSRYGPDNDYYWFPSNEIVIGIRCDDFAENGSTKETWQENESKQNDFLSSLMEELANNANKILKTKVNVIRYDDYTLEETIAIKNN